MNNQKEIYCLELTRRINQEYQERCEMALLKLEDAEAVHKMSRIMVKFISISLTIDQDILHEAVKLQMGRHIRKMHAAADEIAVLKSNKTKF